MEDLERKEYFVDVVKKYITIIYPMYATTCLDATLRTVHNNIDNFDTIFWSLWKLYKYKERYNLHQSFHYANKQFHVILHMILEKQLRPRTQLLVQKMKKNKNISTATIKKYVQQVKSISLYKENLYKKKTKVFKLVSFGVIIFDIFVTAALIFAVTLLSKWSDAAISSFFLSFVLIVIFTFLKVILDRFFISPFTQMVGRRIYKRLFVEFKETLAMYEAISIVITDALQAWVPPMEVVDLYQQGIAYIDKEKL